MSLVTFTVPSEPKSKSRHRMGVRGGKVYHYKDQATAAAQDEVALYYRQARGPGQPDDRSGFAVAMEFHLKRRQRRDVDNMVKLVLDALTGMAWKDDSQVTEIHAKIIHQSDRPRSEVEVWTTDDLPDWSRRECDHCGELFRMYQSWGRKRYCSQDCRSAALRASRQRSCDQCGTKYVTHSNAHGQRYCSRECASLARTYEATCAECGAVWRKPRSLHRSGRDFCNQACQAGFWRKQRRSKSPGTCQQCGGGTSRKEYTRCNACRLAS
jgi:crossover junction endodeoxyribonuclease RusA